MLPPTLLKTSLRDLLRRPLQTALMILGIALGVAVVIAIDLANTSANRAFTLSTETVVGKATHQIIGGPEGLPEALYTQLRVDWGYRLSAPVVEGLATAIDLDQQPLRILGVDPFAEAPFRSYLSGANGQAGGLQELFVEPNTVAIGAGMADRYGLKVGDPLRLQLSDRFITVTVASLLTPPDANSRRALDGVLLADIATAQELMGLTNPGRLTRIDLILTPDEAAALAARLAVGVSLSPASEQANTVAQLTAAFQLNLTALSLLALVVGMFLIYNTVMFSVVQRRAIFGTLRSLGVTGGQLFWLIQLETAVVAIVGALLGLGLGWLLGQGAVRLVTQTINDLYYVVSVRDAPLTLFSSLKGLGLGLGAGLLAAAAPALEAASVEPITILRRSSLEDRVRRWLPWLGLLGLAVGAVGGALLLATTRSLTASFAGFFAIIIGLALVVPIATVVFMRAQRPAAVSAGRNFGPHGGTDRHQLGQPYQRGHRGADGGGIGDDWRERDDRQLSRDGSELARFDPGGRRLHHRPQPEGHARFGHHFARPAGARCGRAGRGGGRYHPRRDGRQRIWPGAALRGRHTAAALGGAVSFRRRQSRSDMAGDVHRLSHCQRAIRLSSQPPVARRDRHASDRPGPAHLSSGGHLL